MEWAKSLMLWAVDGPGSRFQGRGAIGVAAIAMLLPLVLNGIGMTLFGYAPGSLTYRAMIWLIICCWAVAILYLLALIAFALFRIAQDLRQGFGPRSRDRSAPPGDPDRSDRR